jgi:hypothetical protein
MYFDELVYRTETGADGIMIWAAKVSCRMTRRSSASI